MKYNKQEVVDMIKDKINGNSFLSYKEIASITGYHEKYVLKLKKEVLDESVTIVHGNKFKKPHNAISELEEQKICDLYKRSHATIKQFTKFYGTRSYSCIYNTLKKNGLLK